MMSANITPTQKMLNIWAIILILWACYRTFFQTSLPLWFDELIAKPIIFLLPVYYYISTFENIPILKGVDLHPKKILKNAIVGIAIGSVFFVTGLLIFVFQNGNISLLRDNFISMGLYYAIISFGTGFSEEILSRGFVLKRLFSESKKMYQSVFAATFLFFFLHIPILLTNSQLYGDSLVQVVISDILLSIAVSLIYLQRKSVVVPIIIHAFYNLSLYLFL